MSSEFISIRGAREHNLKNINLDLPRGKLVVITGLSGSGKSSLAFDTIYAEGQRRYVESLSAYARQFLDMQNKPDVDAIEGLSPAISIEQKTTSNNPRSTVGTVTEIYDYLRLLYARIGVPHSPATGLPIEAQSASQMVDRLQALPKGTRLLLLAPVVRGRKGEYKKDLAALRARGFQRVKIDGKLYELAAIPELDKKRKHTIEVVVDRIVISPDLGNRLADSIETALKLSDGILYADMADADERLTFSNKFACPVSGFTLEAIEPRLFSFNSPHGACPHCDGLGVKLYFDPNLVVPDTSKSIREGAVLPWASSKPPSPYYLQTLEAVLHHFNASIDDPWWELAEPVRYGILHGTTEEIKFRFADERRSYETTKPFEGVLPNLQRRYLETDSDWVRNDLAQYQASKPCEVCLGARLKPEALCVKIAGKTIADICALSIEDAVSWFATLKLNKKQQEIAVRVLKEITERLGFLHNVGLDYLNLARSAGTLSGGEAQRIRLASQIGSGLSGVLYVLDEPSIGLHQRDNARLLRTLVRLRDLGNTVIVVEHDEDAIRAADYVVDMGPGAGVHGGQVIFAGEAKKITTAKNSLTADYLTGRKIIPVPSQRRTAKNGWQLELTGATGNNLKNVHLKIPQGTFTCITGVSGSGKSTLTIDTLYRAMARRIMDSHEQPEPYERLLGAEHFDKVIDIDQSPIGRTPRSNPVTYTGAFAPIREWFAGLPEAKARGYNAGRFSFNVKGGRCEACEGDGVIRIEMHFLPDVYVQCDECKGKRYNRETLEVLFKDKSIADVLNMTVDEACTFFAAIPAVHDKMVTLQRVGLSYMKIGQSATTLSGGEAQRIKLAKELSRRSTGNTFYILDEPTTGLHFDDVRKLLEVLHELVEQGNTVVVIEHNLDVIKTADWIVDLGPEGGSKGGQIIATGTPESIAANPASYTGQFLKPYLATVKQPKRAKA